jgi:D-psicose/D-tagatose/L-ribulose 3-epimerase
VANPIGVISMLYARPFRDEHLALLPAIRAAGCDHLELLVPEPGELDPAATRAALEAAGMGVILAARVDRGRDLASPDPAARAGGLAYLRRCVELAAALGAGIVGGPLYGAPLVFAGRAPEPIEEAERARRVERVVEGLAAAARIAAAEGVRLALEPLNRFETDLASTTRHGLELCAAVDHPALGLLLDTFHLNIEEPSIGEAIRAAGPRLVHFQANENHRGFPGSGHVDWLEVARALAAIGYSGPITLEPFRREDERPGVPLARWRPPAEPPHGELGASVAFLRGVLASAARRTGR